MASLTELLTYLESGHTLKCDTSERIIPQGNGFFALVHPWREYLEPKFYNLAGIHQLHSIWEWSVVFLDKNQREYTLSDLAAIDEAIKQNTPRYVFGEIKKKPATQ
jgi:hypothetical protein